MPQYVVIAPDGRRFGPTDFQTLSAWAREGRVAPGMMVEDQLSGQVMTAGSVPGLFSGAYLRPQTSTPVGTGPGGLSLILGLCGLLAWCIPLLGFPVGISAVVFGIRGLKTENRTPAIAGIVLGSLCILLSLANAIIGAIFAAKMMGR